MMSNQLYFPYCNFEFNDGDANVKGHMMSSKMPLLLCRNILFVFHCGFCICEFLTFNLMCLSQVRRLACLTVIKNINLNYKIIV